jgi:hypothetical protein
LSLTSHPTLFDPHPDIARGRHRGNAASEAANRKVEPKKADLRRMILSHLKWWPEGRTCKEVSAALSMGYTTASARLSEMKREGLVVVTGLRRDGAAVVRCK